MHKELYARLIQARSSDDDSRRHETIFNILIVGAIALATAALVTSGIERIITARTDDSNSPLILLGLVTILIGFWYLSRRGLYVVGAYALVSFFALVATLGALQWSFETSEAELIYVVAVVMAGLLIGPRACLAACAVISAGLLAVGYMQAHRILHPDTSWLAHPVILGDAIVYVITFWIIALVMWLAIREIRRSLNRVRVSEATLAAERDSLEVRVVERTKALEYSQQERVNELERFAEFGRVSAGLLHDLANPLTSASLNLAELDAGRRSQAVKQALESVRYLERYVVAARKQLQHESSRQRFSVLLELNNAVYILRHKAQAAKVEVKVRCGKEPSLYGDSVKFSQLVVNLTANAIEAYDRRRHVRKRLVEVIVREAKGGVELSVADRGTGIAAHDLPRIFESFYTTKRSGKEGTGLGLSQVKQIVENDFNGKISVTSTPTDGTRFTAYLRSGSRDATD